MSLHGAFASPPHVGVRVEKMIRLHHILTALLFVIPDLGWAQEPAPGPFAGSQDGEASIASSGSTETIFTRPQAASEMIEKIRGYGRRVLLQQAAPKLAEDRIPASYDVAGSRSVTRAVEPGRSEASSSGESDADLVPDSAQNAYEIQNLGEYPGEGESSIDARFSGAPADLSSSVTLFEPEEASRGKNPEENFIVNAQYRGNVKKSFPDIGQAVIKYVPIGNGEFRLDGHATISNPRNKSVVYEFWLDSTYKYTNHQIRLVEELNDFNSESRGFKNRMERALPFVYLVKYTAAPEPGEPNRRQFRYKNDSFTVRYSRTDQHIEATIYDGAEIVTKIFIPIEDSSVPYAFDKFRIPAPGKDQVMVSFVTTN